MKKHVCSHCKEFVEPEDFSLHAESHLIKTRGVDHEGEPVASRDRVDFFTVEVEE